MPYINTIDINGEVYHVANLTDGEHVVNLPLLNNDDTFLLRGDVIDGLTSTLVGKPLSANQGKILNEKIDTAITTFQNTVDNISKRMIPIARGESADSIAYTATGDDLPTVKAGSSGSHIGKGRQIVFIPDSTNTSSAPTLKLNGGEVIPIRMRAPKNQGSNDQAPDATIPVPTGALMHGVPYTLTFCGKYWLIDSQISQFDQYNENILNRYATHLIGLSDGDTIAVPIINSMDGVIDDMATMFVTRSAEENRNPNENGDVTVPTVAKVDEMIRKDITADYTAWTPESGTEKTVENYAKTLPDGRYRIWNENTDYWFIDTFTVVNSQKWRIIRQYTDEFFYLKAYYGESIMLDMDVEVGTLALGGRTLLTNDNIPLPTAADAGKVLTASAAGRAAWTAVANAEEVAV